MKKYFLLILAACTLVISGCSEKKGQDPSPADVQNGVYFLYTDVVNSINPLEFTVSADDTEFNYYLGRNNAIGSLTVNIINSSDPIFSVPSSVTFADGEYTAVLPVSFSDLPATNSVVKLSIPDENKSIYGAGYSGDFVGALNCLWKSIGTGIFWDTWAQYNTQMPVEVLMSQLPPLRYRIMKPYTLDGLNADEWENWIDESLIPDFIELTVSDDTDADGYNYVTWNKFWYVGLNYQAKSGQPIKAYLPSALSSSLASSDLLSKFVDKNTIELAPYLYIDGLGGFGLQQVLIEIPE